MEDGKNGTHLISNKGYLDSVRYLGLTTIDAINELVDNSFDANADNVFIYILKEQSGISIVIEDDGDGIPSEKIDTVLSFGGRLSNNNKLITGRFGWGLSSAACCQAMRTEIYSKTQDKWFFSYIDLEELKSLDEPIIPAAVPHVPPKQIPLELGNKKTGTIVYLKNCDRLDFKTVDKLVSHVIQNIGEVHRKYINAGKQIKVNTTGVRAVDPLMLIPGCLYSDIVGQASESAEIKPIIVDEIDPSNGKPAKINIKISLMDLDTIRKNKDWRAIPRKVGINIENQGFYLMRHNRQIGRALALGIYTKHPNFNYFRGEISFPPILDKYFGVQTNKSRFSIDPSIRDMIKERLKGHLEQIRKVIKDWKSKADAEQSETGIRPSEEIAAKVNKLLKNNKYEPSLKEIKQVEEEANRKKEEEIRKISNDSNLSKQEKDNEIEKIENKFQFYRPFMRVLEFVESGNFYFPRPKGKNTEVIINTAHPFYKKIYEHAAQNNLDVYLDLLLFTLAKAELEFYDKEEIRKFYERQRAEWSAILSAFLDECIDIETET